MRINYVSFTCNQTEVIDLLKECYHFNHLIGFQSIMTSCSLNISQTDHTYVSFFREILSSDYHEMYHLPFFKILLGDGRCNSANLLRKSFAFFNENPSIITKGRIKALQDNCLVELEDLISLQSNYEGFLTQNQYETRKIPQKIAEKNKLAIKSWVNLVILQNPPTPQFAIQSYESTRLSHHGSSSSSPFNESSPDANIVKDQLPALNHAGSQSPSTFITVESRISHKGHPFTLVVPRFLIDPTHTLNQSLIPPNSYQRNYAKDIASRHGRNELISTDRISTLLLRTGSNDSSPEFQNYETKAITQAKMISYKTLGDLMDYDILSESTEFARVSLDVETQKAIIDIQMSTKDERLGIFAQFIQLKNSTDNNLRTVIDTVWTHDMEVLDALPKERTEKRGRSDSLKSTKRRRSNSQSPNSTSTNTTTTTNGSSEAVHVSRSLGILNLDDPSESINDALVQMLPDPVEIPETTPSIASHSSAKTPIIYSDIKCSIQSKKKGQIEVKRLRIGMPSGEEGEKLLVLIGSRRFLTMIRGCDFIGNMLLWSREETFDQRIRCWYKNYPQYVREEVSKREVINDKSDFQRPPIIAVLLSL